MRILTWIAFIAAAAGIAGAVIAVKHSLDREEAAAN